MSDIQKQNKIIKQYNINKKVNINMKTIKVNSKFGLNHNNKVTTYDIGLHEVEDDIADHFYVKLNSTVLEDIKEEEIKPVPKIVAKTVPKIVSKK